MKKICFFLPILISACSTPVSTPSQINQANQTSLKPQVNSQKDPMLYQAMVSTDEGTQALKESSEDHQSISAMNLDRVFAMKNVLLSIQQGQNVCSQIDAAQASRGLIRYEQYLQDQARRLGPKIQLKDQKSIEDALKSCELKCKCEQWVSFIKAAIPSAQRQKSLQLEYLRAEFKIQKQSSEKIAACARFNAWACETKQFKKWVL